MHVRPPGVETTTRIESEAVDPPFETVRTYMVVLVTVTVVTPEVPTVPTPGEILADDALWEVQRRVTLPPPMGNVSGDAVMRHPGFVPVVPPWGSVELLCLQEIPKSVRK